MRVFAISDLHLALAADKPMDVFGAGWDNYMFRIKQNWLRTVAPEDIILLPGDLSWATYLDNAAPDFKYINDLPGRKIVSKGNHDYWWSTHSKLNQFVEKNNFENIFFLQNNAFIQDNLAIVGSRGWKNPEDEGFSPEDEKILNRELERLKLSLQYTQGFEGIIIAMLHYPPFSAKGEPTAFVELMLEHKVDICVYGHLHGRSCSGAMEGSRDGIQYRLVSADYLAFTPVLLGEW